MAKIHFKRTLHPVGQGAFFTEQFFSSEEDPCIFCVVYDCGSLSRNICLDKYIDSVFHTKSHIDLLFISHFDADHINGIQFILNNRPHLMDCNTKVIIPFKYAKVLSALEGIGAYSNIAILIKLMMKINVQIIGIDDIDLFEGTKAEKKIFSVESLKSGVIYNGTILSVNLEDFRWDYVPFIIKRNRSNYLDKFKDELKKIGNNLDDLLNDDYIMCHFNDIREAGIRAGTGNTINMHSLQLISVCLNSTLKMEAHGICITGQYDDEEDKWTERKNECSLLSSCLYTGDTNLKSVYYYAAEMLFVRETIENLSHNCQLGMMQIPHHGSQYNYPSKLANDSMVLSAFVNYEPNYRQQIFDENINISFGMVPKLLFKVMNCLQSEFVATL